MNSRLGGTISWYSYNLPNVINKTVGGITSSAQFFYGAGRGRYKQIAITPAGQTGQVMPAGTETTLYIGGLFERVTKPSGVIESKHYILAGKDAIAIKTQRSNAVNDVRYLHKDHLGSVDVITNEAGAVVQRLSYDAFGKRRSATAWSGVPTTGDWTNIAALTHRGYTFHEGLDNVDLIHMNGRVYDPNIGRFISADPFIQAPLMSQSLNRYSYVMNNPLSLIDPSGYSWLSSIWKSIKRVFSYVVAAVLYVVAVYVSIVSQNYLAGAKIAGWASMFLRFAEGGGGGGSNRGLPGFSTPGINPNPLQAQTPPQGASLPTRKQWAALDELVNVFFINPDLKEKGGISVSDEDGVTVIRVTARVWADTPGLATRYISAVARYWESGVVKQSSDGKKYALTVDMRLATEMSNAAIVLRQVLYRSTTGQASSSSAIREGESARGLAHEFGHSLGFHDFYRDVDGGKNKLPRSVAREGFENILMGTGTVVTGDMLERIAIGYQRP